MMTPYDSSRNVHHPAVCDSSLDDDNDDDTTQSIILPIRTFGKIYNYAYLC